MAMTGVSGTAAALSMGCRTTLVRTAIRGIRSGVKVMAEDTTVRGMCNHDTESVSTGRCAKRGSRQRK